MKYALITKDRKVEHFSASDDKTAKEIGRKTKNVDSVYRTPRGRVGKLVMVGI